MQPREFRAYVMHGYVECFIHASCDYWDVWHRAMMVPGAHMQTRYYGEAWSKGFPASSGRYEAFFAA